MTPNDLTSVAILAGGKSLRMGVDKAALQLRESTLLEHVLRRVKTLDLPIKLIADQREKFMHYDLPIFADTIPDSGSIGGIYTALSVSETPYSLCVAVDMPFLNPNLLTYLINLREGYDGVVPVIAGFPEPLHAVYSKSCLPTIRSKIMRKQLKISGFYEALNIRFVDEPEIRKIDPDLQSFVNINTPEEWQAAQDRLAR